MKTTLCEKQEWITMRWHDNNEPSELPRLLLVGDSIVNGHVNQLQEKLKDEYVVDCFTTSKIVSDVDYLSDMEFMFAKREYDVIIFNNGLHGLDVDDADYASELFNVLSELRKRTKTLIWRDSTPCYTKPDGTENPWTEKVPVRNKLARIEVEKLDIPVIDCYNVLKDRPDLVTDGVHFHADGYEILAETVAVRLREIVKSF